MFFNRFITPILDNLDSERMHVFAKKALHFCEALGPLGQTAIKLSAGETVNDPRLQIEVAGLRFKNPVLVGAGWDKAADAVRALSWMGFAGVEVGTVTELPQAGNPKPRQFVVGPGVAINCLGFNGPGMEVVARNLVQYQHDNLIIGVNIGKNKEVTPADAPEKHAVVVRRLAQYAHYITINLASPNTPGLRDLLAREHLVPILEAVKNALGEIHQPKPLFVKVSPDMSEEDLDAVIDVCLSLDISGVVVSNTTVREDLKAKYGERWRKQAGGLSGNDEDYRQIVNQQIRHVYQRAGKSLAIIGVGGVDSAKTAIDKLLAGASLVQVVVGIRGRGPTVANEINRGICQWMDHRGVKSIREVIGAA